MKPKLVILTTHFGTNFSGGSTATCEIFSRLENQFEEVVVVGTQLGNHPFRSIRFIKYDNWFEAIRILKGLSSGKVKFYGDFYNSFLFILARVPYYFTYHDNWPELGKEGVLNGLRSLIYTNIYIQIFKRARTTFTVSLFKLNFINKHTSKTKLIYNGFNRSPSKTDVFSDNPGNNIIMVGNIDDRKYRLALRLFKQIQFDGTVTIDIYGRVMDAGLARQLDQFPFVNMKGFVESIPYASYKLLLHTSIMENLPIVFCEALYNELNVLAFDVGGSKEIIDGSQSVLIPPYDLKLMADKLKYMLEDTAYIKPNMQLLNRHSWELASEHYSKCLLASNPRA